MTFHQVGRETLGTGAFLKLERVWITAGGHPAVARDVINHPGGVGILPVDGPDVLFIRQYRVAIDQEVLEIPAGKLDRTDGDPAREAARELREELGVEAIKLVPLGSILPSPGYTSERIHLFVADGILGVERATDGLEEAFAEIVRIRFDQAMELLDDGQIDDAKTQIALARWARRR